MVTQKKLLEQKTLDLIDEIFQQTNAYTFCCHGQVLLILKEDTKNRETLVTICRAQKRLCRRTLFFMFHLKCHEFFHSLQFLLV